MHEATAQGILILQNTEPHWNDTVLPFQLEKSDIRGRLARLDGVLTGVLKQHSYPPVVEALVAEMTLLTALIGQTIKLRWKLSLQVQSNGPVKMISTDYYAPEKRGLPARIRAYANFDKERLDQSVPIEQIGEGYFAVLIDQGMNMQPYQGITSLSRGSLFESAETYFAQSEQLPTKFSLSFAKSMEPGNPERWRAGGIMLQHMPKKSAFVVRERVMGEGGRLSEAELLKEQVEENWQRVNFHLQTVEELELIGPTVTPNKLLMRLFNEEIPRVFEAQKVKFGCLCSEERVRQSLSIYSAKDIETMTTKDGKVTADCQFCGSHYVLDPSSVGLNAKKS